MRKIVTFHEISPDAILTIYRPRSGRSSHAAGVAFGRANARPGVLGGTPNKQKNDKENRMGFLVVLSFRLAENTACGN